MPVCLSASLGTPEPRASNKATSEPECPRELLPAQSRETLPLDLHILRLGAANGLSAPRVSHPVFWAVTGPFRMLVLLVCNEGLGGCLGGRRGSREGVREARAAGALLLWIFS